jgi:RNA polymerase sigma-70 factor (ECF subfamily)
MIIRKDICAEAMRLCLLLSRHKAGNVPETFALLSLMCFHASRFESRMDDSYSIILLQQQDRSKWNKELIALGYKYLNESAQGDHLSVYHLEAAIAAEHCRSSSFEHTDWKRLLRLYDLLLLQKKTTFVRLNRAVVIAHVEGPEKAIQHVLFIEGIEELINKHYIYSAVLGDLYLQNGQLEQARNYLNKAYELTQSPAERKLLESKIKSTR